MKVLNAMDKKVTEFADAVSAGIKEKIPCELELQDTSFIKPGAFALIVRLPDDQEAVVNLSLLYEFYQADKLTLPKAITLAIKEIGVYKGELSMEQYRSLLFMCIHS